jgi:hypothetical protein
MRMNDREADHTMDTQSLELTCPTTGEVVPAHLNAAELFTKANIDGMRSETQIWWSEVLRQYVILRASDPTSDPANLLETVLRAWPEDHAAPER